MLLFIFIILPLKSKKSGIFEKHVADWVSRAPTLECPAFLYLNSTVQVKSLLKFNSKLIISTEINGFSIRKYRQLVSLPIFRKSIRDDFEKIKAVYFNFVKSLTHIDQKEIAFVAKNRNYIDFSHRKLWQFLIFLVGDPISLILKIKNLCLADEAPKNWKIVHQSLCL